jgi:hypothetical protein
MPEVKHPSYYRLRTIAELYRQLDRQRDHRDKMLAEMIQEKQDELRGEAGGGDALQLHLDLLDLEKNADDLQERVRNLERNMSNMKCILVLTSACVLGVCIAVTAMVL